MSSMRRAIRSKSEKSKLSISRGLSNDIKGCEVSLEATVVIVAAGRPDRRGVEMCGQCSNIEGYAGRLCQRCPIRFDIPAWSETEIPILSLKPAMPHLPQGQVGSLHHRGMRQVRGSISHLQRAAGLQNGPGDREHVRP